MFSYIINDHISNLCPSNIGNLSASGIIIEGTFSAAVTFGQTVYKGTTDFWALSDADVLTTLPCLGMAVCNRAANKPGYILIFGFIRNDAWTSMTIGAKQYLSTVAGAITATRPTLSGQAVQDLGVAIATKTMFFAPSDVTNYGDTLLYGSGGPVSTKTTAYTATSLDYTLLCDATAAAFTVTLPAAASSTGRIYNIKKIDVSVNAVTIDANASELIDGALTKVISAQWASATIHCNGTAWYII